MAKKTRIAVIRADGVQVWTVHENLSQEALFGILESAVGGYVESVPFPPGAIIGAVYCNEEGLVRNLKPNLYASKMMCRAWVMSEFDCGRNPLATLNPYALQLYGDVVWVYQE